MMWYIQYMHIQYVWTFVYVHSIKVALNTGTVHVPTPLCTLYISIRMYTDQQYPSTGAHTLTAGHWGHWQPAGTNATGHSQHPALHFRGHTNHCTAEDTPTTSQWRTHPPLHYRGHTHHYITEDTPTTTLQRTHPPLHSRGHTHHYTTEDTPTTAQ